MTFLKSLRFATSILYADDTTIFIIGNSLRFLRIKMQSDLNSLSEWLNVNSLKLNVARTKAVIFNAEGLFPQVTLEIDHQMIECVTEFKFLTLILDNVLSFETYYLNLYRKLLHSQFIIRKLGSVFPYAVLKTLYYAYFHSNLAYCLLIWYPLLSKKHQNSLYICQKRMIRIILGVNSRLHCMPLFRARNVLTLTDLVFLENCKLIFKIDRGISPILLMNMFNIGRCNTHSRNLEIKPHLTSKVNSSFLCRSVSDWLRLETKYKLIENVKPFAKRLKFDLIQKY